MLYYRGKLGRKFCVFICLFILFVREGRGYRGLFFYGFGSISLESLWDWCYRKNKCVFF